MMVAIKNGFKNERLGLNLDVYTFNDKEWFSAKDISDYLGYIETKDMTRNLDSMEKHSCRHSMQTPQGNKYEAVFIDEYGVYEAILKVRKGNLERYAKAQAFQDWVFGEVLPSIRKNGGYIDGKSEDEIYANTIKAYNEAINKLKAIIQKDQEMAKVRDDANRKLLGDVRELEYKWNTALETANDMRFAAAEMYVLANPNVYSKMVEKMDLNEQNEIFNILGVKLPYFRESWERLINAINSK